MLALLGATIFALALLGAATVLRRIARGVRGIAEWLATKVRSYAHLREKRVTHRKEGVTRLQAETANTLALALLEARQEITALRAERSAASDGESWTRPEGSGKIAS